MGSNPTREMDVCVRLLCLCCPVSRWKAAKAQQQGFKVINNNIADGSVVTVCYAFAVHPYYKIYVFICLDSYLRN
jgi:hypothetical protein